MVDEPIINRFKLPDEVRRSMEKEAPEIAKADQALDVMRKLGMDVSELEDKLNWAKNIRKTMLEEFD